MAKKTSKLPSTPFEPLNDCTYYWGHPLIFGENIFSDYVDLCKLILKCSKVPVADGIGREGSSPVLEDNLVSFNGVYPDCRETFYFPRISDDIAFLHPDSEGNLYRYCETGNHEYDLVVGACLEAAVHLGLIRSYSKENGNKEENMLWLSVKSHLNKGEIDAN